MGLEGPQLDKAGKRSYRKAHCLQNASDVSRSLRECSPPYSQCLQLQAFAPCNRILGALCPAYDSATFGWLRETEILNCSPE